MIEHKGIQSNTDTDRTASWDIYVTLEYTSTSFQLLNKSEILCRRKQRMVKRKIIIIKCS